MNHHNDLKLHTDENMVSINSIESDKQTTKIHHFKLGFTRAIKASQAHDYLGMNRHRFNQLVKPQLKIIPFGSKGAVYDRLDLDAWFEEYKSRNGRPAGKPTKRGKKPWDEKERQVCTNVETFGTSTKRLTERDFAKALALSISKKRNTT